MTALAPLVLPLVFSLASPRDAGAELPAPTGPDPVGTRVLFLADATRPFRRGPEEEPGPRPVPVQLWYPAEVPQGAQRAPYLPDDSVLSVMIDGAYYGRSAETLESWSEIDTHAAWEVPFVERDALPVLLVSHGLGMGRFGYTSLCVELASHGYVVAAVDHPAGGITVLSDGRVLSTADDPEVESHWEERVVAWARDLSFVLDELATRVPAGRLDLTRVGVLGHSMGGAAALVAACRDARVAACADLDGAPIGLTSGEGFCAPGLFVKAIPDRAEPTGERERDFGGDLIRDWASIAAAGPEGGVFVGFRGAGHMSFGDAPFLMPDTITRFGGRVVAPERTHRLVVALLLAHFDRWLRGASGSALTALDAEPELGVFLLAPGG